MKLTYNVFLVASEQAKSLWNLRLVNQKQSKLELFAEQWKQQRRMTQTCLWSLLSGWLGTLRCEMFLLTFLSELPQQFLCPARCKDQESLSRYALILTPSLSTSIFQILVQNVFVSMF